jgi:hypothetical protein
MEILHCCHQAGGVYPTKKISRTSEASKIRDKYFIKLSSSSNAYK